MLSKKLIAASLLALACFGFAAAACATEDKFSHPFYAGITGGYGSTTWFALVPSQNKQNAALALSTPISVNEGGGTWGLFAGWELMPSFAIEAAFNRYAMTNIYFSRRSLFSFQHQGRTQFASNTEDVSLMGKLMVFIPTTTVRVYSSVGVAGVRRYDTLANLWRASPTFGFGLNYNFTPHVMGEFGANYTGGYGESELTPATDFVPFLYSIFMRLAYRF
jgi:hypothetical protein